MKQDKITNPSGMLRKSKSTISKGINSQSVNNALTPGKDLVCQGDLYCYGLNDLGNAKIDHSHHSLAHCKDRRAVG